MASVTVRPNPGEYPVLRRQRIDRRRDQPQAVAVEPVWRVLTAGEHERVRPLEVAPEELPALNGSGAGRVAADVGTPRDASAGTAQRLHQAGRLRVVQHDDVTGLDQPGQVLGQHSPVVRMVLIGERLLGGDPVNGIVQALGEREEPFVAIDDQPPGPDARVQEVAEQIVQHLGHAAAGLGGTHVPDGAALQLVTRALRGGLEPRGLGVGQHAGQRAD
jgi:hypothetical protein